MNKIVVDTNIIFGALLNTNSRIGQLLINSGEVFEFFAPQYLREEIFEHKARLQVLIKKDDAVFLELYESIIRHVNIISGSLIDEECWSIAKNLCQTVDVDDTEFVACTELINGKLWTGDLKLIKGLRRQGYARCITTDALFDKYTKNKKGQ